MEIIKFVIFLALFSSPGTFLLKNNWGSWWWPSKVFSSVILGLQINAILAYILSSVGLFSHTITLLLIINSIAFIIIFANATRSLRINLKKADVMIIVFAILATYLLAVISHPFGKLEKVGINLYGAHFVDSTWHLSLVHMLNKSIPPENPIYSGTKLNNYHYFSDLYISTTHKITGIDINKLFFMYYPIVFFLSLSILIASTVIQITGSKISGLSSLIFIMLSSNMFYIGELFSKSANLHPSNAWIDLYSTIGVNMPLTASLCLMMIAIKALRSKLYIAVLIILSSLFFVKSHTAVVVNMSLLIYTSIRFLLHKEYKPFLVVLTSSIFMYLTSFSVINSGKNSALILSPLWFIRVMMESPDHLNNQIWSQVHQYYQSIANTKGIIKLYSIGLLQYISINIGPLLLGLFSIRRSFVFSIIALISFGLSHLFIYSSGAIVTLQFFYLCVISLAILTSILIGDIFKSNKYIGVFLMIFIWSLLLRGVYFTQNEYYKNRSTVSIALPYVELINFFSDKEYRSVILSNDFRSGSWFTAYTGMSAFLGDFQISQTLFNDVKTRENISDKIFTCQNTKYPPNIKYIVDSQNSCIVENELTKLVYSNSISKVFEIYGN